MCVACADRKPDANKNTGTHGRKIASIAVKAGDDPSAASE
jgi:hypothetical protein